MKLIKEIPNLSGLSCLNGLNGKPNSEQLFNRPPEGLGGGGEGRRSLKFSNELYRNRNFKFISFIS